LLWSIEVGFEGNDVVEAVEMPFAAWAYEKVGISGLPVAAAIPEEIKLEEQPGKRIPVANLPKICSSRAASAES
jgi:hypothetical protein